jgi:hypothetical protein
MSGRVVVVTGASAGVGRAVTSAFGEHPTFAPPPPRLHGACHAQKPVTLTGCSANWTPECLW